MGLFKVLQDALTHGDPAEKFAAVAQHASLAQLGAGLTAAMRSSQTPPWGEMVAQMFAQSSATQKAGFLNEINAALGPGLVSSIAGGLLSSISSNPAGAGAASSAPTVTPERAAELSPAQARQIAEAAQSARPDIVDTVGHFYAQHADLIKTLGVSALSLTLQKLKDQTPKA